VIQKQWLRIMIKLLILKLKTNLLIILNKFGIMENKHYLYTRPIEKEIEIFYK